MKGLFRCRRISQEPSVRRYRYLIRVEGHLDPCWSEWLHGMSIATKETDAGYETELQGAVADQAALYGLLIKLNNLNLALLAVQRLEPDGADASADE